MAPLTGRRWHDGTVAPAPTPLPCGLPSPVAAGVVERHHRGRVLAAVEPAGAQVDAAPRVLPAHPPPRAQVLRGWGPRRLCPVLQQRLASWLPMRCEARHRDRAGQRAMSGASLVRSAGSPQPPQAWWCFSSRRCSTRCWWACRCTCCGCGPSGASWRRWAAPGESQPRERKASWAARLCSSANRRRRQLSAYCIAAQLALSGARLGGLPTPATRTPPKPWCRPAHTHLHLPIPRNTAMPPPPSAHIVCRSR